MAEIKISLASARVNAKMTQEQAAKAMHVSKKTIINWEHGKVYPSFATLNSLADIYNIPRDNIFLPSNTTLSYRDEINLQ